MMFLSSLKICIDDDDDSFSLIFAYVGAGRLSRMKVNPFISARKTGIN